MFLSDTNLEENPRSAWIGNTV